MRGWFESTLGHRGLKSAGAFPTDLGGNGARALLFFGGFMIFITVVWLFAWMYSATHTLCVFDECMKHNKDKKLSAYLWFISTIILFAGWIEWTAHLEYWG